MNDVFKVVIHRYVKHLVKISQKKLRRLWRADVGQILCRDAELLEHVMKDQVRLQMMCVCMYIMYVSVFTVHVHTCCYCNSSTGPDK